MRALSASLPDRRVVLPVLLALVVVLMLSPIVSAGAAESQAPVNYTVIELADTPATVAALAALRITPQTSERAGWLRADVTDDQRRALDAQSVSYDSVAAYVLITGGQLSGEASVVGSNSGNINIQGYQTVNSFANVSGAPSGKTVIRADLGVDIKYPAACNLYVMAWHPSNALWYHAWNGNQNPCTPNINRQWQGITAFNYADINGQWKLTVQETDGKSEGFIDYWFIRLYYEDNSTPTPTRTPTRTATPIAGSLSQKVFLPIIISGF